MEGHKFRSGAPLDNGIIIAQRPFVESKKDGPPVGSGWSAKKPTEPKSSDSISRHWMLPLIGSSKETGGKGAHELFAVSQRTIKINPRKSGKSRVPLPSLFLDQMQIACNF